MTNVCSRGYCFSTGKSNLLQTSFATSWVIILTFWKRINIHWDSDIEEPPINPNSNEEISIKKAEMVSGVVLPESTSGVDKLSSSSRQDFNQLDIVNAREVNTPTSNLPSVNTPVVLPTEQTTNIEENWKSHFLPLDLQYKNINHNYKVAKEFVDLAINQSEKIQKAEMILRKNSFVITKEHQLLHLFSLTISLRSDVIFREQTTASTKENSYLKDYVCCDCHKRLFSLKFMKDSSGNIENIERILNDQTFNHECNMASVNILKSTFLSRYRKHHQESQSPRTTKLELPMKRSARNTLNFNSKSNLLLYEVLHPELNQAIPHSYNFLVRFIYTLIKINHSKLELPAIVLIDTIALIVTNVILFTRFGLNKDRLQSFCNPLMLVPSKTFEQMNTDNHGYHGLPLFEEILHWIDELKFKSGVIKDLKALDALLCDGPDLFKQSKGAATDGLYHTVKRLRR